MRKHSPFAVRMVCNTLYASERKCAMKLLPLAEIKAAKYTQRRPNDGTDCEGRRAESSIKSGKQFIKESSSAFLLSLSPLLRNQTEISEAIKSKCHTLPLHRRCGSLITRNHRYPTTFAENGKPQRSHRRERRGKKRNEIKEKHMFM